MSKYELVTRLGPEKTNKKGKKLDHLTRDVIAAQKEGKSYGQWKAEHPYTADEDDEPGPWSSTPSKPVKTCPVCGAEFYVSHPQTNKLYCSEKCRERRQSETKAARKAETEPPKIVACAVCGKNIEVGTLKQKYCSEYCARKAERARQKERRGTTGEIHTCASCGKEFIGRANRKYCSPQCYHAAEHRRYIAKNEKENEEHGSN